MSGKKIPCPACGAKIDQGDKKCSYCGEEVAASGGSDKALYSCPVCNARNKLEDTFTCPACGTEHLCIEHRIKVSGRDPETKKFITDYYCSNCWKNKGFAVFSE